MKNLPQWALVLCMALAIPVQAADQAHNQSQTSQQASKQEPERVYGSELMTPQERSAYQDHMRALKTQQEHDAYRMEHHKEMQKRAKAQGKTLPDMPPPGRGPGTGPGMGQGKGTGPGY